jgi:hypothetical protein
MGQGPLVRLKRDWGVGPERPRGVNTRFSRLPTPKARGVSGDKIGMMAGLTGSITISVPDPCRGRFHDSRLRLAIHDTTVPMARQDSTRPLHHSPLLSRLNQPHLRGCCGRRFRCTAEDNSYCGRRSATCSGSGEDLIVGGWPELISDLESTEPELCIDVLDHVGRGSFIRNHPYAVSGGGCVWFGRA